MKQNKYDAPHFFTKYSQMPRSLYGLEAAGEWPFFRALLPDLRDERVLDLGCGFGWHCRYARREGARSAVGVDLSEKMLEQAKAATNDPAIEYQRGAIEDLNFAPAQFDVVISSLALHYIDNFEGVCRNVYRWLTAGGAFVFSVEHPMFTARAEQTWWLGANEERLHWPVDNYQEQGARRTHWMADDVIKYHRTTATYVNTLVDAGFQIARLVEPAPSAEMLVANPEWKDEYRRPTFMLMKAVKAKPSL
jgi:SAM-dependent methyltransferase